MTAVPVLQITNVRKTYQSLRPLRLRELSLATGERVSIAGLDAGAAEVVVNLVTGASVPDEGEILVLGRNTRSISDGDEWLASLDRFGIVSPRAVLLDSASLLQNLVMPFTLEIDPIPPDVAARAAALGAEVGIAPEWIDRPIAGLSPEVRIRAHLARAVALGPALLILEHPTAGLDPRDSRTLAADVTRVASARSLATLIISEDADFTAAAATRRYTLHGASGELRTRRGRFFGL
jgi:ABC-type transporter Mla maintaining outer membrane lipid asymmetry ATPase subunit MlaF